jgi:hypothetical protein
MNFSEKQSLKVGDLVEHAANSDGVTPQGKGLLTGVAKRSKNSAQNVWHVTFFNGMKFKIMERYLKKIQGALDAHEQVC